MLSVHSSALETVLRTTKNGGVNLSALATISVGVAISRTVLQMAGNKDFADILESASESSFGLAKLLERKDPITSISKKIAEKLDRILEIEFRGAKQYDKTAAIDSVASLLEGYSKNQDLLMQSLLSPKALRASLMEFGGESESRSLGGISGEIFTFLLSASIDYIARLVPQSKDFSQTALVRLLVDSENSKETLEKIFLGNVELGNSFNKLIANTAINPNASGEYARYLREIQTFCPSLILGRTSELKLMEEFSLNSPEQWFGWKSAAQSGKTALMATFALNAPADVEIVPFFIVNRRSSLNSREGFLAKVLPRLAEIAGKESVTIDHVPSRVEYRFSTLLEEASSTCEDKGKRLVLLVDGLDEDIYNVDRDRRSASIAGMLPAKLPDAVRVIVSTRPNPPMPLDLPSSVEWAGSHPLKSPDIWHELEASEHARAAFSTDDVHELMRSTTGFNIAAFLAASGGGLSPFDLANLCESTVPAVKEILSTSPGRLLLPDNSGKIEKFILGHSEVSKKVLETINPDLLSENSSMEMGISYSTAKHQDVLRPWVEKICSWARCYSDSGWPPNTPEFILSDDFIALLVNDENLHELILPLVASKQKIERIAELNSTSIIAAVEHIQSAISRLIDNAKVKNSEIDLYTVGMLICSQNDIVQRSIEVPSNLPSVYARLGRADEALALAKLIPKASDRMEALALLASEVAKMNDRGNLGQIIDEIQDLSPVIIGRHEQEQSFPLAARALCLDNRFNEAMNLATKMKNDTRKFDVYSAIVECHNIPFQLALSIASISEEARIDAFSIDKVIELEIRLAELFRSLGMGEKADRKLLNVQQLNLDFLDMNTRSKCLISIAQGLSRFAKSREAIRALRLARSCALEIESATHRVRKLIEISISFRSMNLRKESFEALRHAQHSLVNIPNMNTRARIRCDVIRGFVRLGSVSGAVKMAKRATDSYTLSIGLTAAANEIALRGNASRADDLIDLATEAAWGIQSDLLRCRSFADISECLANIRRDDDAYSVALQSLTPLEAWRETDLALEFKAIMSAACGDMDITQRSIDSISAAKRKSEVLSRVALNLADSGRLAESSVFARKAVATAMTIAIQRERSQVLGVVAIGLAACGLATEFSESISVVEKPIIRVLALTSGSIRFSLIQMNDVAIDCLQKAQKEIDSLTDSNQISIARSRISRAFSELGEFEYGRQALGVVQFDASSLELSRSESGSYVETVYAMVALGEVEKAEALALAGLNNAKEISNSASKVRAFAMAVDSLLSIGNFCLAREAAISAFENANFDSRVSRRKDALTLASRALLVAGCLDEAFEAVSLISNYKSRATTLAQMAKIAVDAGNTAIASILLAQSWHAAGSLLDTISEVEQISSEAAGRLYLDAFLVS